MRSILKTMFTLSFKVPLLQFDYTLNVLSNIRHVLTICLGFGLGLTLLASLLCTITCYYKSNYI